MVWFLSIICTLHKGAPTLHWCLSLLIRTFLILWFNAKDLRIPLWKYNHDCLLTIELQIDTMENKLDLRLDINWNAIKFELRNVNLDYFVFKWNFQTNYVHFWLVKGLFWIKKLRFKLYFDKNLDESDFILTFQYKSRFKSSQMNYFFGFLH